MSETVWTTRRFSIAVGAPLEDVRARYEGAVPAYPSERFQRLVSRNAAWDEMLAVAAELEEHDARVLCLCRSVTARRQGRIRARRASSVVAVQTLPRRPLGTDQHQRSTSQRNVKRRTQPSLRHPHA